LTEPKSKQKSEIKRGLKDLELGLKLRLCLKNEEGLESLEVLETLPLLELPNKVKRLELKLEQDCLYTEIEVKKKIKLLKQTKLKTFDKTNSLNCSNEMKKLKESIIV